MYIQEGTVKPPNGIHPGKAIKKSHIGEKQIRGGFNYNIES
jgi:hypothetical protein